MGVDCCGIDARGRSSISKTRASYIWLSEITKDDLKSRYKRTFRRLNTEIGDKREIMAYASIEEDYLKFYDSVER